jgi:hypothetical protein
VDRGVLQFARDHVGQHVKSPGGLGGQCVDLVENWWLSRGLPPIPGNAVNLWRNAPPARFLAVMNGPANFPVAGDVVIWREYAPQMIGAAGHCAVALAADASWLLTLDQNWPDGSPVAVVLHDYGGVVGWLRGKP